MPKVLIQKFNKLLTPTKGSNLMKCLLEAQIPVASSCGGEGICRKCFVTVETGQESLSAPTPTELYLWKEKEVPDNQRMSCQCEILGEALITLRTPYW